MNNRFLKSCIAAVLSIAMASASLSGFSVLHAQAAGKTLTLDMAKKLALANSNSYAKIENEYNLKIVSQTQAVKSLKAKEKNMSTFRWSPLLNFHFPEKPDMSEAYEFQFKPLQLQAEVDKVKHSLTDEILSINEEVSTLYTQIVTTQTSIDFDEDRLEAAEDNLEKNRIRLSLGQATKSDVQYMESQVKSIEKRVTNYTSTLMANKKKLSNMIGLDVTTGYTFVNPYVSADIPRDQLDWLIDYTLERDQNYYEVSMDATTAELAVRTNYSLMERHYGSSDMGYISSYVNQALSGIKVNGTAFKKSYDQFLDRIDSYWQGSKRILFIKIPREWFRGELDGIRYVEDEPYGLYEATLEYQDALLDKNNTAESLAQEIESNYNMLISAKNSYLASVDDVDEAAKTLEADRALNRLGQLTYDEYSASQEDYESLQNDMLDALSTYSETLYSFDRLTCGGVSAYLSGASVEAEAAEGGLSYITEEYADGAYYYIEPIIQEQEFRLGVSIPDDFDIDISDFELWCDNEQIGSRTSTDEQLRHLTLAVDSVDEVKIRFYNGDQFVDDCVIDPDVLSGPLDIIADYAVVETENKEIGTYTSTQGASNILVIQLMPSESENIESYRIRTADGKYLISDSQIPINTPFKYPSLLEGNISELEIEFYGEGGVQKDYTGYFNTASHKLMKD